MSVTGKLFAIVAIVAIVPLAISVMTAGATYERELDRYVDELHLRAADAAARVTSATLESTERTVRGLASAIPWAGLTPAERQGALRLVYQQFEDIAVAAMFDAAGAPLGEISHTTPVDSHPAIARELVEALLALAPRPGVDSMQIGAPLPSSGGAPIVPIALGVSGSGGARWTLAVGLSLRSVCAQLAAERARALSTRLLGPDGELMCGAVAGHDVVSAEVALARGWRVIAETPRAIAYAAHARIQRQGLYWLALAGIAAITAGLVLGQSIRRPLRRLARGADAIARGDLSHRVEIDARDELGAVGRSFDHMAAELESKSAEITAWNQDLQRRVEARTAELKEAQDQLLESRKLGAIASLGAGVAHEINNPLMGVLGMTQVLLARRDSLDEAVVRKLGTIEREAQRIREIVENLQALAQDRLRDAVRIDVAALADGVARARAAELAAARVEVVRAFAAGVPRVFGNVVQLEQAIGQLVDNSIKAMAGTGGRLTLAVRSIEDELVALEISDTGHGIARELLDKIFEPFFTTKQDWRGLGLGLALAHRIVEVHHGRIRPSSTLGAGTTMTVTLPAARHGAHLS